MLLNEAIYRSPKFLRNFLDFEINTGSDIKGEPSKKELKRIEKQKQKKLIQQWKERWAKIDESLFIEFYEKTFPGGHLLYPHLDDIYKRWVGNFHLWTLYDKWLDDKKRREKEEEEKEKQKKKEQDKLTQELDSIYDRILNDFKSNPYTDKYITPTENGKLSFHYKFENGDIFILRDNKIIYESNANRVTYIVGLLFKSKFIHLANLIVNNGRPRPGGSNSSKSKPKEENRYSSHPKGALYQRLKETVELRKSQLDKMPKGHPDRKILENELDAAQRAFDNLKSKYQFENLSSFYDFKF